MVTIKRLGSQSKILDRQSAGQRAADFELSRLIEEVKGGPRVYTFSNPGKRPRHTSNTRTALAAIKKHHW